MRFTDFLKATVLISAAAATALAAVTLAGAASESDDLIVPLSAGWWVLAGALGAFLGRRSDATPPIARLLAGARTTPTLPEIRVGLMLLNRLWPLLVPTVAAGALAFLAPQIPGIATGFAIIWALAWRNQESAVTAIEERDGVRFYIERTSPFAPIQLVRTPGFKSSFEMNGALHEAPTALPEA